MGRWLIPRAHPGSCWPTTARWATRGHQPPNQSSIAWLHCFILAIKARKGCRSRRDTEGSFGGKVHVYTSLPVLYKGQPRSCRGRALPHVVGRPAAGGERLVGAHRPLTQLPDRGHDQGGPDQMTDQSGIRTGCHVF